MQEYTGSLMELCQSRRGVLKDMKFVTPTRGSIVYEIPLAEVMERQLLCHASYHILRSTGMHLDIATTNMIGDIARSINMLEKQHVHIIMMILPVR